MNPSGVIHDWTGPAVAQLPELGKVKVGKKTISSKGKEIPTSVDHFVFTGKYGQIVTNSLGGDKLTRIPIIFSNPNPAHSCNERLEIRKGKNVYAFGDGRTFRVWSEQMRRFETRTVGSKEEYESLIAEVAKAANSDWYRALTLRFMMPLPALPMGEWSFHTKAEATSIKNIRSAFHAIPREQFEQAHLPNFPDLVGAACILETKMHVADNPAKSKYPIVSLLPLVVRPGVEAPVAALLEQRLAEASGPLALPSANVSEGVDPPHEEEMPVIQVQEPDQELEPQEEEIQQQQGSFSKANKAVDQAVHTNSLSKLQAAWDANQALHSLALFHSYCLSGLEKIWKAVRSQGKPPMDWNQQVKALKQKITTDYEQASVQIQE